MAIRFRRLGAHALHQKKEKEEEEEGLLISRPVLSSARFREPCGACADLGGAHEPTDEKEAIPIRQRW